MGNGEPAAGVSARWRSDRPGTVYAEKSAAGIVRSLQISVGTAALVAVYALTQEQFWTCVMFGALAYSSYQALQSYRNSWR